MPSFRGEVAGSRLLDPGRLGRQPAAEWLQQSGWTARGLLAGNGGSASGPLAGAAMTQRPELFGAMLIDIPVLDLLRFDRFTVGGRWKAEFGSPEDPADFQVLRAISPYHALEPGRTYPPTLVTAGERDETAVPSHAYKFVARLQERQKDTAAAWLQVVWGGGHGFGITRELAFLDLAMVARTGEVKPASGSGRLQQGGGDRAGGTHVEQGRH